jgi:hypothetical protein
VCPPAYAEEALKSAATLVELSAQHGMPLFAHSAQRTPLGLVHEWKIARRARASLGRRSPTYVATGSKLFAPGFQALLTEIEAEAGEEAALGQINEALVLQMARALDRFFPVASLANAWRSPHSDATSICAAHFAARSILWVTCCPGCCPDHFVSGRKATKSWRPRQDSNLRPSA